MSLKSRIEALILQISNAKTSLRDALKNKGVDLGSQPSFEALRSGIERIQSGNKYKGLMGKGSIFSTNLDTNETARKRVMSPDKLTFTMKINCNLDSIQSALEEINGSFTKGDLVAITTYAVPVMGVNYGLYAYNISENSFSYFWGYNGSIDMGNGYPRIEEILFLESVNITSAYTAGGYNFSFTGYPLGVGKSPVD